MRWTVLLILFGFFAAEGQAFAQWDRWGGWNPFGGTCGIPCAIGPTQAQMWWLSQSWQPSQPWGEPQGMRLVCRPVSVGHELKDIGYMAAAIGGFSGWRGGITGGGIGGYGANHERDCWYETVSYQPPQAAQPSQPPSAPPTVVAPPAFSGVPIVIINDSENWILIENEATRQSVAILGPKTRTPEDFKSPPGRMRFLVITPENGVITGKEVRAVADPTLPGWRIPAP